VRAAIGGLLLGVLGGVASAEPPLLCDVRSTTVTTEVAHDAPRGVYVYTYTLTSGASNTGAIDEFGVEINAGAPQNAADPDLGSIGSSPP
jgi:hypothetical protein